MLDFIKKGIISLVFFIPFFGISQTDLSTKVEYTYFPQADSDNSFRRFRARVNYPIKLGERAYLVPGFQYRNVELQYNDHAVFPTNDLERFQSFAFRLAYTFGLKNDWRFATRFGVQFASNFAGSDFVSEDLTYIGGAYLIKDRSEDEVERPWRVIFGIMYSTKSGRPFPLPIANYFKTVNENWQYTVGVPETKLTFLFNEKNRLTAFAELDGFYANIREPISFINVQGQEKYAEDITMTVVLGGLGYEHYFTEHLLAYAYFGYTIYNDIRLRNEDKDDIYNINDTNSFYNRIGIEFKL